jgi:acyl-CoA thioesterase-1
VGEAVASDGICARAESRQLPRDEIESGQPPESAGDFLLNTRVCRPNVKVFTPKCSGKAELIEAGAGDLDRARQRTRIESERAHAIVVTGNEKGMSTSYNIMSVPVMTRIAPLFMGLVTLLCVSCARPDSPAADARSSSADLTPVERPIGSRPRIVFLGDSLTAGYGLAREESVPSLIQARLRTEGYLYEVVNAGVSGDTSAGGLSRLDWSLEGDVKVLVIELGANDGLRGVPVASLKRNLTEVITRATSRGIKVVLTGMEAPPNFGAAYTSEFRQVYRDLAKSHHVAFMPFYLDGVAGIPSLNLADGMHPNAEGSRIIERAVWRILEPLLDTPADVSRGSTK